MIRVRTGSRLHFGLFSLPSEAAAAWLNQEGKPTVPRRQFGGVGLMIDKPGIELTIERADRFSAEGPLAERASQFAHSYCNSVGINDAFHLRVESAAPEHAGLGTGTQLGLAVARAIAELTDRRPRDAVNLARQVGRGVRSALGVHGFDSGGFLVEGGKLNERSISPLLARHDFPADWHILLITPRDLVGTHSRRELDAFAAIAKQPQDDRTTEALCRLVLLAILPALTERDLKTFGKAVYDFNRRVGEMFRSAQGGLYAHPRIEAIIKLVRLTGIHCVGQSSWGPTVFAIASQEKLLDLCNGLRVMGVAEDQLLLTTACNHGAVVSA
ncbi:MAG: beta-RFAP synthase [Gemmataceae bacterium]|nr:beta-RFAP synthase [Gemmataceae bacterium]